MNKLNIKCNWYAREDQSSAKKEIYVVCVCVCVCVLRETKPMPNN